MQVLDCVHAFGPKPLFAGTMLIVRAQALPEEYAPVDLDDDADLQNSHGERAHKVVDAPYGSVSQYAHTYKSLFHSVTQVVYDHHNLYVTLYAQRLHAASRTLEDTEELNAPEIDNVYVLPLLLQVEPDHSRASP